MVPWMSGLVNGLQNRLQQFESARHLARRIGNLYERKVSDSLFYPTNLINTTGSTVPQPEIIEQKNPDCLKAIGIPVYNHYDVLYSGYSAAGASSS